MPCLYLEVTSSVRCKCSQVVSRVGKLACLKSLHFCTCPPLEDMHTFTLSGSHTDSHIPHQNSCVVRSLSSQQAVSPLQVYTALSRARTPAGLAVSGLRGAIGRGGADRRALEFYQNPAGYTGGGIPPGGTLWPPDSDLQVPGSLRTDAAGRCR